ncbi:MAG TPA: DUF6484 domain-containing protein [Steroidobacteraceae bacterium]|nr:DUF6484 domain-containing protein [Steroidobacteraceae bacterium]
MRRKEAQVAHLDPGAGPADVAALARLARIASVTDNGVPLVSLPGESRTVVARLAIPATREQLAHAAATGQAVLVVLEDGDAGRPILIGFIEPAARPAPLDPVATDPQVVEADVDGKRVRVVAQDEIVLECGNASITLRRNGRVIIKGTYVETHSDGTNRIKGGQVRIN